MPHLSPMLWIFIVSMFLVVLMIIISSFWWMQLEEVKFEVLGLNLKFNSWVW